MGTQNPLRGAIGLEKRQLNFGRSHHRTGSICARYSCDFKNNRRFAALSAPTFALLAVSRKGSH